jgi:hypothetical protein
MLVVAPAAWALLSGMAHSRWLRGVEWDENQGPPAARLITRRYGIEVVWRGHHFPVQTIYGPIHATDATPRELDDYSALLAPEFLSYPAGFVRRAGLKRIVLCRDLSHFGQPQSGVVDFERETLYLDVVRGGYDPRYQRRFIHHEFFHFIDLSDDGLLEEDQHWERLNRAGFRLHDGKRTMRSSWG